MSATGRKRHAKRPAPREVLTEVYPELWELPADQQTVRDADDNYATPAWCTRALLLRLQEQRIIPSPRRFCRLDILEPCAGAGAIVEVLGQELPEADVRSVELDKGRAVRCTRLARRYGNAPTVCADFLALSADWTGEWWPQLVITNPPYRQARQFVDAARHAALLRQGHVAMLLRLNFLGSQARAGWLRDDMPDVNVLAKRPSFTPDGKTDATEYAWFVWGPGRSAFVWVLDLDERDQHLLASGRKT